MASSIANLSYCEWKIVPEACAVSITVASNAISHFLMETAAEDDPLSLLLGLLHLTRLNAHLEMRAQPRVFRQSPHLPCWVLAEETSKAGGMGKVAKSSSFFLCRIWGYLGTKRICKEHKSSRCKAHKHVTSCKRFKELLGQTQTTGKAQPKLSPFKPH